jgi:hypothetical protein
MSARDIFEQSNGVVTKEYYAELEKRGIIGTIAVNLFRAQKTSTRAKVYRGRRFRGAAYDTKQWAMDNLCRCLEEHGSELGITFGWKEDPASFVPWVLYIDLPNGQCSFHSPTRGKGPCYPGDWDRQHASEERILAFCDAVMEGRHAVQERPASADDVQGSAGDCEERAVDPHPLETYRQADLF